MASFNDFSALSRTLSVVLVLCSSRFTDNAPPYFDSRLGKSDHVKDLSKCECVSTNLGNKIFFGFVTLFFKGFNSETNPSSQLMEKIWQKYYPLMEVF